MSDLIDRQAAIDVCNKAIDLWQGQLGEGIVIAVRKKIEQLPSAQPEIIRCKDCRYVWNEDGWDNLWCNRLTGSFSVEKDGGCSWGKI